MVSNWDISFIAESPVRGLCGGSEALRPGEFSFEGSPSESLQHSPPRRGQGVGKLLIMVESISRILYQRQCKAQILTQTTF